MTGIFSGLLKFDDGVRNLLTPTRYYVKQNLGLISNDTKEIVRAYATFWAENGRICLQIDHWVPKHGVIAARQVLGILLVVWSEDYSSHANVVLSIENCSKKTHSGKIYDISYM